MATLTIRADCTNSRQRTFLLCGVVCSVLFGCGIRHQQISETQYIDGCYYSVKTISNTKANQIDRDFTGKKPCSVQSATEIDEKAQ